MSGRRGTTTGLSDTDWQTIMGDVATVTADVERVGPRACIAPRQL